MGGSNTFWFDLLISQTPLCQKSDFLMNSLFRLANLECIHISPPAGASTTKRRPDEFSKQSSYTQDTPHPLPRAFCNVAVHVHLPINICHNNPLLTTIIPPSTTHSAPSLRCPLMGSDFGLYLANYVQVVNINFSFSYSSFMLDLVQHSAPCQENHSKSYFLPK
ncbi:uncharacterized protein LOC111544942 [Piliocolobus tephrosceles]|uniref:uncharacterized protein LOC111544942 n=1 Tax=Piliocolobus tephrosceles TaxID=591936 RepID=UPI000C2AE473|nr:uncharacterized protein LOC111544942 [Piliocolobus tephrosceles]